MKASALAEVFVIVCCAQEFLFTFVVAPYTHMRSPLSPGPDSLGMQKTTFMNPISIVDANDTLKMGQEEPTIDDNVGPPE